MAKAKCILTYCTAEAHQNESITSQVTKGPRTTRIKSTQNKLKTRQEADESLELTQKSPPHQVATNLP